MADAHDNRATVSIGGEELELVASKLAERIYGDRFRSDAEALGPSNAYRFVKTKAKDDAGNEVEHIERIELTYIGRLKFDISVSATSRVGSTYELPEQVVAATWAMARAAGSTEKGYDEFFAWWLSTPSNTKEELDLWEAVCVDLAERAFFRDIGRRDGPEQPDEGEEPGGDE